MHISSRLLRRRSGIGNEKCGEEGVAMEVPGR
jgi:hypothetical protein